MKTIFLMLVMCLFAAAAIAQQSLGDVARANRANKHSSSSETKLNDDNMARTASPSTADDSDTDKKADDKKADDKDADGKDAAAKEGDAKDSAKKDTADAQKQKGDELKKQIAEQTKEISTLQRELDIAQREARLRAASFYGGAGTMLRDQAKYAEAGRKDQAEIDTKKQALDAAQQKLADLQEQARKAGIPQQ